MTPLDETLLALNRLIRSMQRLKNTVGDKFLESDNERLKLAIYTQNKHASIDNTMRLMQTELHKNERSFQEDFEHENGNYQNKCHKCQNDFIGHKRRVTCKLCEVSTNLGLCKEKNCIGIATHDYNGHQHYVCDYHFRKLNDEFDEEYR